MNFKKSFHIYHIKILFLVLIISNSSVAANEIKKDFYKRSNFLNDAPSATKVTFNGILDVGSKLTGSYKYTDNEDDPESGTTFKWFRSDDASGTNKSTISGATNLTYTLDTLDIGKYISFEVTPNDGNGFGTSVESNRLGEVIDPDGKLIFTFYGEDNNATSVSVVASGSATSNSNGLAWATGSGMSNQINGDENFAFFEGDAQGPLDLSNSLFLISPSQTIELDNVLLVPVSSSLYVLGIGAKNSVYGIPNVDYKLSGKANFSLTSGTFQDFNKGTYNSVFTHRSSGFNNFELDQFVVRILEGIPPSIPPSAVNLSINGNLEINETVAGNYSFADPQDSTESGTTYQWYRSDNASGLNKAVISGATDTLYTITSADVKKYLSFEVTPNNGSDFGEAVESSREFVIGPPDLISIERQSPETETTKLNEVTFRVTFDTPVFNVDSSDFVQTGSIIGEISSVSTVTDTTFEITISDLPNSSGTVGIAIKGVGGQSGSNDIAAFEYENGSATITQTDVNDYLNQSKLGQSFQATTNNFFTSFTIFPEDGQHSFSGTADLEIYSGNEDDGGATLLTSQSINITTSTDAGGQTFTIVSPPALTSGETYSFILENWSGSGSYALSSSTSGDYADGRAIFTGNNSGHSAFDLKFELFEGTKNEGASLLSTAPATNESYTKQSNAAPVASNVLISGTTNVGDTLFASYDFTDTDGDEESGSAYKWYASDDASGTNKSVISGATDTLYVVELSSNGKFLSFQITPSDGIVEGDSVESNRKEVEEFFAGGSGTSGDPYQVSTPTHLHNIRVDLSASYKLINDINLDVAPYNTGSGWEPIGNSTSQFSGTLDGDNFTISNLYINRATKDTVGFFSNLNSTVKNVRFKDANVTGRDLTGIIAGSFNGYLDKSSVSGSVTGRNKVGSLFGIMLEGTSAEKSYSEANVSATGDRIGGLTGILETAYFNDSFFAGSVSTVGDKVGGIMGEGYETITSGGLTRVYNSGSVSGANQVGAIGGDVSGTQYTNVFWDTQTTGQSKAIGEGDSTGVSGKSTSEMKRIATFSNFNFSSTWVIDEGTDYPKLRERKENNLIITGNEGWRMLSTPVTSSSFGTLLDGLWTQGFTGADVTHGTPNVLVWNEASKAFQSISNATDTPTTGTGFITYVFSDDNYDGSAEGFPKVLTNNGSRFSGTASPGLTFTDSGTLSNDGWNLLGNPYGTSINWDGANGWSRTNLDGTFYVWSDSAGGGAGSYLSWNGTTGTLEDGKIAPWQGFWVKANASSPSISMNDSVKSTGGTLFKQKPVPQLKFKFSGNEISNSSIVMFHEDAQEGKDEFDAYKLNSLNSEYLLLGTTVSNLEPMDIQALPLNGSEFILDLNINGTNLNGEFTLSWEETNIPADWEIILEDKEEGTETWIKEKSSIDFILSEKTKSISREKLQLPATPVQVVEKSKKGTSRFVLRIRQSMSVNNESISELPKIVELEQNYPNPFNPTTTIEYGVPETGDVTLEVYDLLGRKVATLLNTERKNAGRYTVNFDASNLASGMYIYRLQVGNSVLIKKLTLIK